MFGDKVHIGEKEQIANGFGGTKENAEKREYL